GALRARQGAVGVRAEGGAGRGGGRQEELRRAGELQEGARGGRGRVDRQAARHAPPGEGTRVEIVTAGSNPARAYGADSARFARRSRSRARELTPGPAIQRASRSDCTYSSGNPAERAPRSSASRKRWLTGPSRLRRAGLVTNAVAVSSSPPTLTRTSRS